MNTVSKTSRQSLFSLAEAFQEIPAGEGKYLVAGKGDENLQIDGKTHDKTLRLFTSDKNYAFQDGVAALGGDRKTHYASARTALQQLVCGALRAGVLTNKQQYQAIFNLNDLLRKSVSTGRVKIDDAVRKDLKIVLDAVETASKQSAKELVQKDCVEIGGKISYFFDELHERQTSPVHVPHRFDDVDRFKKIGNPELWTRIGSMNTQAKGITNDATAGRLNIRTSSFLIAKKNSSTETPNLLHKIGEWPGPDFQHAAKQFFEAADRQDAEAFRVAINELLKGIDEAESILRLARNVLYSEAFINSIDDLEDREKLNALCRTAIRLLANIGDPDSAFARLKNLAALAHRSPEETRREIGDERRKLLVPIPTIPAPPPVRIPVENQVPKPPGDDPPLMNPAADGGMPGPDPAVVLPENGMPAIVMVEAAPGVMVPYRPALLQQPAELIAEGGLPAASGAIPKPPRPLPDPTAKKTSKGGKPLGEFVAKRKLEMEARIKNPDGFFSSPSHANVSSKPVNTQMSADGAEASGSSPLVSSKPVHSSIPVEAPPGNVPPLKDADFDGAPPPDALPPEDAGQQLVSSLVLPANMAPTLSMGPPTDIPPPPTIVQSAVVAGLPLQSAPPTVAPPLLPPDHTVDQNPPPPGDLPPPPTIVPSPGGTGIPMQSTGPSVNGLGDQNPPPPGDLPPPPTIVPSPGGTGIPLQSTGPSVNGLGDQNPPPPSDLPPPPIIVSSAVPPPHDMPPPRPDVSPPSDLPPMRPDLLNKSSAFIEAPSLAKDQMAQIDDLSIVQAIAEMNTTGVLYKSKKVSATSPETVSRVKAFRGKLATKIATAARSFSALIEKVRDGDDRTRKFEQQLIRNSKMNDEIVLMASDIAAKKSGNVSRLMVRQNRISDLHAQAKVAAPPTPENAIRDFMAADGGDLRQSENYIKLGDGDEEKTKTRKIHFFRRLSDVTEKHIESGFQSKLPETQRGNGLINKFDEAVRLSGEIQKLIPKVFPDFYSVTMDFFGKTEVDNPRPQNMIPHEIFSMLTGRIVSKNLLLLNEFFDSINGNQFAQRALEMRVNIELQMDVLLFDTRLLTDEQYVQKFPDEIRASVRQFGELLQDLTIELLDPESFLMTTYRLSRAVQDAPDTVNLQLREALKPQPLGDLPPPDSQPSAPDSSPSNHVAVV